MSTLITGASGIEGYALLKRLRAYGCYGVSIVSTPGNAILDSTDFASAFMGVTSVISILQLECT